VARLAKEGVESARVPAGTVGSLVAPDYLTAALARLAEWPLHTLTVLPFIVIVWLGMWAARRRLLEDPSHVRWLRRVAATGLGLAVLGGLPLALVGAGMMRAGAAEVGLMLRLQLVSGMFAGPGYVAVFGLVAFGLTRPGAPPIPGVARALASLGRRSLSAYLFQSVAWLLLLSPYTLALGRRFRSPMITAEAVALLVWLATLAGAAALERRSRSGPAESLLRRLTYGSSR
jgi:uncharacterized membrane protein YeiB